MNPYESPQLNPLEDIQPLILPDRGQCCAFHVSLFLVAFAIVSGTEIWRDELSGIANSAAIRRISLAALSVASLLLAASRRYMRITTFPHHFGHWLLMCDGVAWFADQPLQSLSDANYMPSATDPDRWELNPHPEDMILVLRSLFHMINLGLFLFAFGSCAHERFWRWYAWSRAVYICWCILQSLFFTTGNPLFFAIVISAIVTVQSFFYGFAVIHDVRGRASRDYLHWLGVGLEGYIYLAMNVKYAALLWRTAAASWS